MTLAAILAGFVGVFAAFFLEFWRGGGWQGQDPQSGNQER
jgi:hypothetical protein